MLIAVYIENGNLVLEAAVAHRSVHFYQHWGYASNAAPSKDKHKFTKKYLQRETRLSIPPKIYIKIIQINTTLKEGGQNRNNKRKVQWTIIYIAPDKLGDSHY